MAEAGTFLPAKSRLAEALANRELASDVDRLEREVRQLKRRLDLLESFAYPATGWANALIIRTH